MGQGEVAILVGEAGTAPHTVHIQVLTPPPLVSRVLQTSQLTHEGSKRVLALRCRSVISPNLSALTKYPDLAGADSDSIMRDETDQ